MHDLVIHGARVMTCDPARPGLGLIDRGAIAIDRADPERGRAVDAVTWIGDDGDRPRGRQLLDARGALVTPGLVDCHTHAMFAGDRAREFGMRAAGKSYLDIAAAGGGIAATLEPTRAASRDELARLLLERLDAAWAGGTTTIEVKTGYDLTVEGELRQLDLLVDVGSGHRQVIVPTLLVHLVPPERRDDREAYVREVCEQLIPRARGRARSVDVYCDEGAFSLAETRAILEAARRAGLGVRAHIGQFTDLGGAELLGELGALSADHVEQISASGIAALARAGTVAVMLPGACVQLRLPVPPIHALRAAGVAMAVATDLNPGSSYCETLPIQMWLATTHYGMTVEEAWLGVTRHAATALGLAGLPSLAALGTLVVGAPAQLVLWKTDEPSEVPYRYGANLVDKVGRATSW
jgi:imidazolonepropionase